MYLVDLQLFYLNFDCGFLFFFLRSMLLPSGTWKCNLQYVFEARIFHTFLL